MLTKKCYDKKIYLTTEKAHYRKIQLNSIKLILYRNCHNLLESYSLFLVF